VSIQQICSRCESSDDIDQDGTQRGKRKNAFWEDPVGDMLSYLFESRPWRNHIIAIAHNAKVFDLYFILNRAILLKWRPERIMNGQKILCMSFKHMKFIDSLCFLPFPLRKLSSAFDLTASKSWYPHYFNKMGNLNYVGQIPNI
jgi:hypothetical protein